MKSLPPSPGTDGKPWQCPGRFGAVPFLFPDTQSLLEHEERDRMPTLTRLMRDDRPHGLEDAKRPDFLDETIAVWQPLSERPLTREDAREITENVVGFFSV